VLLMGELPNRSGENANIADLSLPPGQAEFVEAVAGQGKPVVLVVFAGRPLALSRQASQVDALLFAWHPGIEGGAALGDILFGLESPSGRLPITFPRRTGQVPFYYNHKNSGRPLAPGTWFKSRYLDTPTTPLYPFGHGLTYTTFSYENLKLSSPTQRGEIIISVQVTNTGSRPGVEVVQLYVRDLVGSLTRPVRELKGFQRISIQPGETRSVVFTLPEDNLAFTRADGSRGVEPGRYHAWIGPDSAGGLMGEFSI
jgi:beta-glucosidase